MDKLLIESYFSKKKNCCKRYKNALQDTKAGEEIDLEMESQQELKQHPRCLDFLSVHLIHFPSSALI